MMTVKIENIGGIFYVNGKRLGHDIHHIIPRSKFGKKNKAEQDKIENLMALCRFCHDKAHAEVFKKDFLTEIHLKKCSSIRTRNIQNSLTIKI